VKRLLLVAAAALAGTAMFGAQIEAAPARKAAPVRHPVRPVARDWTRTIAATPQGGFRMGNPAARVKLVEYGSLTCGHCAHFAAEGVGPLMAYVRRGTVSYEYRNYVLNEVDIAASLLARCAGTGFFRVAETLYATQPEWIGRTNAIGEAESARLETQTPAVRLQRIADVAGLPRIAAVRGGVSPVRARACLASKPGLDRLMQMEREASAAGVTGTPTFFINGGILDTNVWAGIEPHIRQAGG
jgi:protein-disulfide isomerase